MYTYHETLLKTKWSLYSYRSFLHFIVWGWSGVVFAATVWAWTWCWVSMATWCEENKHWTLQVGKLIVKLYSPAKESTHTQLCWVVPHWTIHVFPYISLFENGQELTFELQVESGAAPPQLWKETVKEGNNNYRLYTNPELILKMNNIKVSFYKSWQIFFLTLHSSRMVRS